MSLLEPSLFGNIYTGRRVLVTGHTGFKGSWLALWLERLGAKVAGFALGLPSDPAHFPLLGLHGDDRRGDLCDFGYLLSVLQELQPEIVFHLAAQPLVPVSYRNPVQTYASNVLGTVHLLEACRLTPSVRAVVAVTTDKCYEDIGKRQGYREEDRLGGLDPYSASKACCEIVASSYRRAFASDSPLPLIATCRSGNAIGGGDWATDRLVPSLVRSAVGGPPVHLRLPEATRPWQHVLEPLGCYLLLGQRLWEGDSSLAMPWNVGPEPDAVRLTVAELTAAAQQCWNAIRVDMTSSTTGMIPETLHLSIDCASIRKRLGWHPAWAPEEAIARTFVWYRTYYEHGQLLSREQIVDYVAKSNITQWNN